MDLTGPVILDRFVALPRVFRRWTSLDALADISAEMASPPPGYEQIGYWPITFSDDPTLDPTHEERDSSVHTETIDAENRRVLIQWGKRARDLDMVKAARAALVDAKKLQLLFAGFTYDFGGGVGEITLQTTQVEQAVWLGLKARAAEMVGTDLVTIRDINNQNHQVTAAAISAALSAMWDYGQAIYAVSWSKKDAIAAALTAADAVAVDIATGWP